MEITPSILTANFCELGKTLDEAVEAGIKWIHMDVMDGNWVINRTITFGPALIRTVRDRLGPNIFIDCHLMINNAEETWEQYAKAGVNMIIAHFEAVENFEKLITDIHGYGIQVGCVINPNTEPSEIIHLLPNLDLILVMSVVPGKGGQSFMDEVEGKVRYLRNAIDNQISSGGYETKLMIDGGIKNHNAAIVSDWGIDIAVVGSGLINDQGTIKANLNSIHAAINK
ncbi:ribulose-phosphate 3-epimerase [Euryarchaeota archaeon]|nr:ribulose-phosphate 3-epimerase [Euryarchaeota archaeon]|tara:strand:+ start:19946 stop:20626 length:681 start_codon:yes stop_codon:yes gene_type:complete